MKNILKTTLFLLLIFNFGCSSDDSKKIIQEIPNNKIDIKINEVPPIH